jgi:hypothetical protein
LIRPLFACNGSGNRENAFISLPCAMAYGIVEHYVEELADWTKILVFHKSESGSFERRLATVFKHKRGTPDLEKESGELLDLFLVQHQQFDFLQKQIESQQHRLSHNITGNDKPVENPIASQQNSLRSRMQSIEKEFNRTKYNGYLFLSSFLEN